jgi:hypothetical protein
MAAEQRRTGAGATLICVLTARRWHMGRGVAVGRKRSSNPSSRARSVTLAGQHVLETRTAGPGRAGLAEPRRCGGRARPRADSQTWWLGVEPRDSLSKLSRCPRTPARRLTRRPRCLDIWLAVCVGLGTCVCRRHTRKCCSPPSSSVPPPCRAHADDCALGRCHIATSRPPALPPTLPEHRPIAGGRLMLFHRRLTSSVFHWPWLPFTVSRFASRMSLFGTSSLVVLRRGKPSRCPV